MAGNPEYRWRSHSGRFYQVKEMETRHLFYTWLMIWNHIAIEKNRIWFKHHYEFSGYYTMEYILESFRELYIELKSRDDVGFKSKQVMERIESMAKLKEAIK